MKSEANKEFMGKLSLQFGQTTDGGTKFTCGRQSGMDGCILDEESNNVHADASFKGGFYGSAHVQAMTLGYILKTN